MTEPVSTETTEKRRPGRPRKLTKVEDRVGSADSNINHIHAISEPIEAAPALREAARTPLRERLRAKAATVKDNSHPDRFHIPDDMKPEGVKLDWKKFSVYGQEDPYYIANMRAAGWEPMTHEDFPDLVPEGYKGPVIKDGMMLMGMAEELYKKLVAKREAGSRQQIADREAMLGMTPKGTAPRTTTDLTGRRLGVQKEMVMPIAIEE